MLKEPLHIPQQRGDLFVCSVDYFQKFVMGAQHICGNGHSIA